MSKKLEESQRVPSILLRKIDIANLLKFATTKQLVALIFTILFFLSSVLTLDENIIVVIHGRDNL